MRFSSPSSVCPAVVRQPLSFLAAILLLAAPVSLSAVDFKPDDVLIYRQGAGAADIVWVDGITGTQAVAFTGSDINGSWGMAVDPDGNLVLANRRPNTDPGGKILRVDSASGLQTIVTSNWCAGASGYQFDVTVNSNGDIFAADAGQIVRVDPVTGQQTQLFYGWTPGNVIPYGSVSPIRLTFDQRGWLHFYDNLEGYMRQLNPVTREYVEGVQLSGQGSLHSVKISTNGNYFVASEQYGFLIYDGQTGQQLARYTNGLVRGYTVPTGLDIDSSGNAVVIVANVFANTGAVVRVNPVTGDPTVIATVKSGYPWAMTLYPNLSSGTISSVRWDRGANTFNWSDPDNWSSNALPAASSDVLLDRISGGPFRVITFDASAGSSNTINSLRLFQGQTALDTRGLNLLTNLTVLNGANIEAANGLVYLDLRGAPVSNVFNVGGWLMVSNSILTTAVAGVYVGTNSLVRAGGIGVQRGFVTNWGAVATPLVVLQDGTTWAQQTGSVLNASVVSNFSGSVFNLLGGNAVVTNRFMNAGSFIQGGGLFDPEFVANSGSWQLSAGTNVAGVFLNESGGQAWQSGGEHKAGVATNLGQWIVSGGLANLTNVVNASAFTLSNGTVVANVFANQATGTLLQSNGLHSAGFLDNAGGWVVAGGTGSFGQVNNAASLAVSGGVVSVSGWFTNAAGGSVDFASGQMTISQRMVNVGGFVQNGGVFNASSLANSGTLQPSAGTNFATVLLNEAAGLMTQSGGEQNAGVATNLGTWTILGGSANLTNVNNGGVLLLNNGTQTATVFVNAAGGSLVQSGGTHNASVLTNLGAWTIAGGTANLTIAQNAGSFALSNGQQNGSLFVNQAGGSFAQSGGTLSVTVATNLGSWTLASGLAAVTGFFNNAGSVWINGGTVSGAVFQVEASGSVLQSDGTSRFNTLTNLGAWTINGGEATLASVQNSGSFAFNSGSNTGSLFINQPGASFLQGGGIQTVSTITNFGAWTLAGGTSSPSSFINEGLAVLTVATGRLNVAVTVGSTGAFSQLIIRNGGTVAGAFGTLGNDSLSSNNSALVSDSGSLWSNSGNLIIGNLGSGNSMTVTNGGFVAGATAMLGSSNTSINNSALVSGAGSIWSNSIHLRVGHNGAGNNLTVADGAKVFSMTGIVGNAPGSSNNSTLITGNGSMFNSERFFVGSQGSSNALIISAGGKLTSQFGQVGSANSSSNNSVLVAGAGSVWTNGVNLLVGNAGHGNRMTIADGGQVFNMTGYVGNVSATNNSVVVSGDGSVWYNSAHLRVGNSGTSNSVTITNGGQVLVNGSTWVGASSLSSNNTILVAGIGSVLSNATALSLGQPGSWNNLTIANGGYVYCATSYVGNSILASNNAVTVTGTGSLWRIQNTLGVGQAGGWSNALMVANGGTLSVGGMAVIGFASTSYFNQIVVTGSGSVWTNSGDLRVGSSGSSNSLMIADGGRVNVGGNSYIGYNASTTNNSVSVTGAGSIWNNNGTLYVGSNGPANRLTVTDAGAASARSLVIGQQASATNNLVTVSGGTLTVTNADKGRVWVGQSGSYNRLRVSGGGTVLVDSNLVIGTTAGTVGNAVVIEGGDMTVGNAAGNGVLEVRNGSFTLSSGTVTTDSLLMTNAAGSFSFLGGTLSTKGSQVQNGQSFTVGDGLHSATLDLQGGTHVFADGLSLSSNAFLTGSGSLGGPLLIGEGGHLAPGHSPGTLIVDSLTLDAGALLDFELGPPGYIGGGTNDYALVLGNLTLDGTLNVSALDGFTNGIYRLFDYNGVLTDNGLQISSVPGQFSLTVNTSVPGQVNLFVVPEPQTMALIVIGGALLLRRRRRFQSSRVTE